MRDQGYLRSLGMARTAQVKRDARIGEAEARRDAGIKVMIRITQETFKTIQCKNCSRATLVAVHSCLFSGCFHSLFCVTNGSQVITVVNMSATWFSICPQIFGYQRLQDSCTRRSSGSLVALPL